MWIISSRSADTTERELCRTASDVHACLISGDAVAREAVFTPTLAEEEFEPNLVWRSLPVGCFYCLKEAVLAAL